MYRRSFVLPAAALFGAATAQSTQTPTLSTGSSIHDLRRRRLGGLLVAQLPVCALPCFSTAASQVGCNGPTDFTCLCNSSHVTELTTKVALCIGLGGKCDLTATASIAGQVCGRRQQQSQCRRSGLRLVRGQRGTRDGDLDQER